MIKTLRFVEFFLCWMLVIVLSCGCAHALSEAIAEADGKPSDPPTLSSDAERIFAAARPQLLQVRSLLADTGQPSSLGSAFLVDADGFAITNYHVVSQYALEPKTYRLEYIAPDGSHGPLSLLAIDVINDLAVVRVDKTNLPFFKFNAQTLAGKSLKGERLYAMGNPLNLGFTIVEGTYNGLVDHSYNDRIHFSAPINAGMSGGPAVTSQNEVVGINVAKEVEGELISFLVPARFAVALLERARSEKPLVLDNARKEISQQLSVWQNGLYSSLIKDNVGTSAFGPYRAPNHDPRWFTCWSSTNAEEIPKPLGMLNTTYCVMNTQLFLSYGSNTGLIRFAHTYVKSDKLNQFQFSSFLDSQYILLPIDDVTGKFYTRRLCYENFLGPDKFSQRPVLKTVWCAQAYRDFDDLYDVSVMAVTMNSNHDALVSKLSMMGVSYANAMSYAQHFLGALQWSK